MTDQLDIELHIPLNRKCGKKQKRELQEWITEVLEERLGEYINYDDDEEETFADRLQVGSMWLRSDVCITEVSV